MPIWNIFICNTRCNIKHNNSTLAYVKLKTKVKIKIKLNLKVKFVIISNLYSIMSDQMFKSNFKHWNSFMRLCIANFLQNTFNIITITKTTEFFLTGSVPNIKFYWTSICVKHERMNLNPKCS